MDTDKFMGLIALGENTSLDFKVEYHNNNVSLIHDILCMANAVVDEERYIIFGVSDEKKLIGLDVPIKHKQNDFIQLIRNAQPNRSLHNSVNFKELLIDGKKFAILTIKNRPDKPFWLTKDYKDKGKTVRAGAIYTRNADGNTPIDSCALDDETELMWRERFALNLPPGKRIAKYLKHEEWSKAIDDSYYCKQFPEFRIKLTSNTHIDSKVPKNDQWMPKCWYALQGKITVNRYSLNYFDMCLSEQEITIWWCDNGREPVPLPEIKSLDTKEIEPKNVIYTWELSRGSLNYQVARVIAKAHGKDIEVILSETKITIAD